MTKLAKINATIAALRAGLDLISDQANNPTVTVAERYAEIERICKTLRATITPQAVRSQNKLPKDERQVVFVQAATPESAAKMQEIFDSASAKVNAEARIRLIK